MKAVWNGQVIAESPTTHIVDGYHYFPPETVKMDHLRASDFTTTCPKKGQASYWNINVNGDVKLNGAFTYKVAKEAAKSYEGFIAFWTEDNPNIPGIEIVE